MSGEDIMASKKSMAFAAVLAAASVSACDSTSTVKDVTQFDAGETLITSADVRIINRTPATPDPENGGVRPGVITCAEPSPDVAKAVTEAFSASASLAGQSLQGPSAEAALALSRAQAESIAQLGERLATIQLLRDALYRACEAYANGAISEITYAVMVSRYDDTVITLMSSELAAGAFGRSLATLSGEAGGSASASADLSQKIEERLEAERNLSQAIGEEGEGEQSESDKRIEDAKQELTAKLEAEAQSRAAASAVAAGAITPGQQNPEIAQILHDIQRKYIENINSDALEVACITALSQRRPTPLADYCMDKLLPSLAKNKMAILTLILQQPQE